ncbi:hypothetical protein GWK47_036664 [Chionoecetes opilio]|uniref:Uncharacterized protein n=1 Tax=Chionoecetes opilio TaxID=41210 RepID=A0A8J5CMY7_CHIOP|nr:hypothetical protein GWK47_036664 [Chionoecetes opilio]
MGEPARRRAVPSPAFSLFPFVAEVRGPAGFEAPLAPPFAPGESLKLAADLRDFPDPEIGKGMAHHSPVARVLVDRMHGLTGKELNTLEILVKYCLQVYFKIYYDIKVHHRLEDGPKQHPHAAQSDEVAAQEGPNSCDLLCADRSMVRTLIMCPPLADGESESRRILVKPYEVPKFSIHTQSTERVVKQGDRGCGSSGEAAGQRGVSSGLGPTTGETNFLLQV